MKKLWILCITFLLTACQAVQLPDFAVNDYKNTERVQLKTSEISVVSNVHYGLNAPFIEYKMPLTPEDALKQWAQNHFVAISPNSPIDTLFIIEKASMRETFNPSEKWYEMDNVEYFLDFKIKVAFVMDKKVVYEQVVGGYEKRSLPIKSSLVDKEEAWSDMLNDMLEKVNDKLTEQLPGYFVKSPNKLTVDNMSSVLN